MNIPKTRHKFEGCDERIYDDEDILYVISDGIENSDNGNPLILVIVINSAGSKRHFYVPDTLENRKYLRVDIASGVKPTDKKFKLK